MSQDQEPIMIKDNHTLHERFMLEALKEAKKAYDKKEVPVGCVIVYNNKIIARAHNKKVESNLPTAHAEIIAINKASKKLGDWRLTECSMYVTLEPCPMCAGGLILSRVSNLYFGASDLKSGSVNSIINLLDYPYNHKVKYQGNILEQKCSKLLKNFFKELR